MSKYIYVLFQVNVFENLIENHLFAVKLRKNRHHTAAIPIVRYATSVVDMTGGVRKDFVRYLKLALNYYFQISNLNRYALEAKTINNVPTYKHIFVKPKKVCIFKERCIGLFWEMEDFASKL